MSPLSVDFKINEPSFLNSHLFDGKKIQKKYNDLSHNKSYKLISQNIHPNFYYINKQYDKKYIEISEIRNLNNFINKSSFNDNLKRRICIYWLLTFIAEEYKFRFSPIVLNKP